MSTKLFDIKIDYVKIDQATEIVEKWVGQKRKHIIATPNPEMIIDAISDKDFKQALNKADLAIADSSRLGWASRSIQVKSLFLRLFYLPFFIFPKLILGDEYPTTTGTDLTERLIELSNEKGFRTAYLGGSEKVANKLFDCLKAKYPKLKIQFCSGNIKVDKNGENRFDIDNYKKDISKYVKLNPHLLTQDLDILFVAFGHIKQEKWMVKNYQKLNAKVLIGVGGAFDYLSGSVPRAPKFVRNLGFEWLFRLVVQPWRIKRFAKLFKFIYIVMTSK